MRINLGSGQKYLDGYVNVDISDDHGHKVDVIADVTEPLPFDDNSADVIIAEHILEHVYLHKQEATLRDWFRVLKPGGRLIISVPNQRELAQAYLDGRINFFIYAVNKFGPYNGNDNDFHKWGFDEQELRERLGAIEWREIKQFNGNEPLAMDWWILALEAIK